MRYKSLASYLAVSPRSSRPLGLLICEDRMMVQESADHLFSIGLDEVLAIGPGAEALPEEIPGLHLVSLPVHDPVARAEIVSRVIEASAKRWMLVAFNGEFAFHPFAETRSLPDLTSFLHSEQRATATAYAIDLYSDAMIGGGAPDLKDLWFDAEGWYGFEREGKLVDVYGGIGWRYEEYSPSAMARINRPALFQARRGLKMRPDLWLDDPKMNTISCPWHNNPTLALMSLRRTRRVLAHPGMQGAKTLLWPQSRRFEWSSEQLFSLGLIEPGQWM